MANHSFTKKQTLGRGKVDIDFSFQSGAAEDASFAGGIGADGYVDAYGAAVGNLATGALGTLFTKAMHRGEGVYGVIRLGVGLYKIILDKNYFGCLSQTASLTLGVPAAQFVQFKAPSMEREQGADGRFRSVIRVQICNTSGEGVDLLAVDRVNIKLSLKNSLG